MLVSQEVVHIYTWKSYIYMELDGSTSQSFSKTAIWLVFQLVSCNLVPADFAPVGGSRPLSVGKALGARLS